MTEWYTIATVPTDGRKVLAAFRHPQFGWVIYIAHAFQSPYGVRADGYAKPTHWAYMPNDPE